MVTYSDMTDPRMRKNFLLFVRNKSLVVADFSVIRYVHLSAGGIGKGCKFPEDSLYVILVGKQLHYNLNPPKYLPLDPAIQFAEREVQNPSLRLH